MFTFRDIGDIGTCWAIYAPGQNRPWLTISRNNDHAMSDAGKTRVREIVDALNLKWATTVPTPAAATAEFILTINAATPNELREALVSVDDLVTDLNLAANLRRIAGKVRTLLRYEVKRA